MFFFTENYSKYKPYKRTTKNSNTKATDTIIGNSWVALINVCPVTLPIQRVTMDEFWKQLDTTLNNLKTDYLDIYQLHCVPQCYQPNDGTGMYECMAKAKEQGIIKHIGVTAHNIETAFQCVNSGLYET